jgi:hypothetical protein
MVDLEMHEVEIYDKLETNEYAQPPSISSWQCRLEGGNAHGWFQKRLD